jgi:hypothetical protein
MNSRWLCIDTGAVRYKVMFKGSLERRGGNDGDYPEAPGGSWDVGENKGMLKGTSRPGFQADSDLDLSAFGYHMSDVG